MANKVLIPFKGSEDLKEAVRIVAFNQGHSNSSKTIHNILMSNHAVAKALRELQRSNKKKSA